MEHPFFNTIVYPWSREDARELHKVFTQAEKDSNQIGLIYKQSVADPPPLTLPAAANIVWGEVLDKLTLLSGLRSLFTLMKAKFPNNEIILNAINAVESAKPASEIKIISNELFIIDCDTHREAISKCTSDTNAKALLIRGLPRSGKSHCRYIFKSIADEKGAEVLYLYDGVITTVEEAIENIFSTLGVSKENLPPKVTTDDAWYRTICTKLKEIATVKDKKIWVVADDLGYIDGNPESGPIMDTRIRFFFEQFVLSMQDFSFAKYFRLLLINYSETVIPTKWKTQMWAETKTDEKDVQQSHIEDFLKEWSAFNKVNMIGPELKAMAVEVITLADTPPVEIARLPRLERIHTILSVKLDEILRRAAS